MLTLSLLAFVPLTWVVIYLTYQRFLCPLAAIPGPLCAKFSRYWIVKQTRRGNMHRELLRLHAIHGPLVRTAPNEVSIADPAAFKKIYGAGSKFWKSEWYGVLQGNRKFDLFAERNESIHGQCRRLVSRIYSLDYMKNLEPYVDDTIGHFVAKMDEIQGTTVDMGKWLQLFAFDVIGEITFSRRFGFMDAHDEDGIFTRINRSVRSGVWLAHVPWILQIHNFLMPVIGNWLAVNDRDGTIRDYTIREVNSRFNRGSDRPDILGRLFEISKEKPDDMNMVNITSVASANVGAGSDTTAISLRAILYFLLTHPEKKARLVEEIDALARAGQILDKVTFDQARNMPYLQAVMYEAMRLYPAIGTVLPRITPPEGFHIGQKYIPGGTIVGASAWVIHRNKEIYGADADAFRPERWLEKDKSGDLQRFFFSFGGGSRTCIGRNISWLEMSKLIPTLFLKFDLTLTDPNKTLVEHCSFFVFQTGLNMILRPRSPSTHVDFTPEKA